MIRLPDNWRTVTAGATVRELLAQVRGGAFEKDFLENLIATTLELMLYASQVRSGQSLTLLFAGDFRWRIRDWLYVYVPVIENEALETSVRIEPQFHMATIIVPPKYDKVFQRALATTTGGNTPVVVAIDSFVDFRITFTSLGLKLPYVRCLADLIRVYNHRIAKAGRSRSLRIVAPRARSRAGLSARRG
jgi:hypothetical protein